MRHSRQLLVSVRPGGFTLLELVIAMSLTGLIMVLAFSGVRAASRSWTKVTTVATATDELQVVYSFLRRELSQARSITSRPDSEHKQSFEGSPERMVFVAPMPGRRSGVAGLYRFTLEWMDTDSGRNLLLSYALNLPGNDIAATTDTDDDQRRILMKGLEFGRFSYYGKAGRSEPPDWQDRWEDATSLPQLVKVTVGGRDQQTFYPDMVLPVFSTGNDR
jgi:general secretion pathway protein J